MKFVAIVGTNIADHCRMVGNVGDQLADHAFTVETVGGIDDV